jgi:hypothetical protein
MNLSPDVKAQLQHHIQQHGSAIRCAGIPWVTFLPQDVHTDVITTVRAGMGNMDNTFHVKRTMSIELSTRIGSTGRPVRERALRSR